MLILSVTFSYYFLLYATYSVHIIWESKIPTCSVQISLSGAKITELCRDKKQVLIFFVPVIVIIGHTILMMQQWILSERLREYSGQKNNAGNSGEEANRIEIEREFDVPGCTCQGS